jgi:hypothetical protein
MPLNLFSFVHPSPVSCEISLLTGACQIAYLKLNGIDTAATDHPIMREITRVREYMAKIKQAQDGAPKRENTLNREVVSRFVKHDLSGNERYDRERAEAKAIERANARIKYNELTERMQNEGKAVSKEDIAAELEEARRGMKMDEEEEVDLVLYEGNENEEGGESVGKDSKGKGLANSAEDAIMISSDSDSDSNSKEDEDEEEDGDGDEDDEDNEQLLKSEVDRIISTLKAQLAAEKGHKKKSTKRKQEITKKIDAVIQALNTQDQEPEAPKSKKAKKEKHKERKDDGEGSSKNRGLSLSIR